MKIIQEENYEYAMRNEVEPYLAAHCRDKFVTGAKEDGQGKTTRAAKLHVKFYETERPRGVVIVSHGFTEGVPKYDEMVYYFLKAGYHVCIPEHTGHGLSYRLTEDPSLVHIDTWKRFVRDFLKICHHTVRRYPNLPRFLFAHSMGGAIGTIAAAWEPDLFQKIILSSPMIRPLTGNVPWSLTVAIAQTECLVGRAKKYVIGQKPYEGNETLETSAAVSEARFTRYNEIRKRCKDIQTSAASYGWLLASIKMSWYLQYYGWKKLAAPVIIFQAEKDAFVSVRTMQKFAKKIQRRGKTSCEYVYIPESKHEIFGSDDRTVKAYIERILNFMAK